MDDNNLLTTAISAMLVIEYSLVL